MIRYLTMRMRRDEDGATIVEFAFVLPVLLLLFMGLADLAYRAYVQAILIGAVQKAGRDSTIQYADPTTIDAKVLATVKQVAGNATETPAPTRATYAQFGYVNGEPFTDTNGNGVRDSGECYSDVNANGAYDSNLGTSGQGDANGDTVYTVYINYPHIFPLAKWLGWGATQTISAKTILKNQPYETTTTTTTTPAVICK